MTEQTTIDHRPFLIRGPLGEQYELTDVAYFLAEYAPRDFTIVPDPPDGYQVPEVKRAKKERRDAAKAEVEAAAEKERQDAAKQAAAEEEARKKADAKANEGKDK